MAIPFVDLKAQYERLGAEINGRIQRVLEHGKYIMGPEVAELEQTLADYAGVKHAIGCSSGTDALLMALMALDVGPGDAVFTTPFTFIATAEVISLLGATPVFVDIEPRTYNLDPVQLETAIGAVESRDSRAHPLPLKLHSSGLSPKGVIAVDLYGHPADYEALQKLCDKKGLFLVEDAAQSFGAEHLGTKACAFGDVAATSFFPAKPLGCYGDGGMAFTDRDDLAETMRSLRVHGKGTDKYHSVRIGLNARLDTLQAAVVLAKWSSFEEELEGRQRVAAAYTERLEEALRGRIALPGAAAGSRSAWAQYTVRISPTERARLQRALGQAGIPAAVYYPKPLHLLDTFQPLGHGQGSFPETEAAARGVLSLPFGPFRGQHDADSAPTP